MPKKYRNSSSDQRIIKKIKSILSFFGVKKLIRKIIFYILTIILKTRIPFLRGVIFDFYKEISEMVFYKNKHGEKFGLFASDNIISKQIFVDEEFDLEKFAKTIDFLNRSKKIKNLYDIGANIGTICIPAVSCIGIAIC